MQLEIKLKDDMTWEILNLGGCNWNRVLKEIMKKGLPEGGEIEE